MSYQIIILFVVFALVIYFSIAELIWQLRNRHFRRRLLIGVLIAALLVSQIDFISLFAKTEAVIVSAAESDAEIASAVDTDAETGTGTESVEVSVIERLSDGIQMYTKNVGMALDEFIQSDAWKIDHILAMVEETEFFGDLVGEERTGDVEEEIPIEIEKDIEEGDLAETEKVTEEENPTETEKDIEEGNLSEAEKETEEENPAETEKEAEEENPSEAEKEREEENSAETEKEAEEENPSDAEKEAEEENPSETEKDTEEDSIEAENNAEESLKEAEIQEETASGDKAAAQFVDNDVPFANADYDDHDTIIWTSWTKTDSLPSSTGNYYLEENVTLTSTWEVQGKVKLCLNNHTYTGPSSLVHVNANAALNIYDCKGKGSHETYTITYDPGTYGKGVVKKQTKFPGKDITLLGAIYTRTGYTQTGWQTFDGSNVYRPSDSYSTDADITLYPVWEANTYKVTYVENGGTISDKSNYTEYTCGVGLRLPIPERDGYTFEGWYTNSKFSGKAVTEITDTDSGNKTFYAKWSKVVATYIITYEPGDNSDEGQTPKTQTKVHGKAVYLSKDQFIRSGFEQTGWIADDESKIYKLGESYKDNKDITLYPVWAKVYTITYNPGEPPEDATGDVEGEIDDKTKIEGVAAKLSTKTFTCSGYKQTGWIKEDGSKEYKLGGNYTDDEDVTLYPIWARSHKVTYNKNGGTITNESKYTSYAEGVGLTLPTPSKSGHTFMGWYTDQNFKGSAVSSITKKDKEDKTFYAKWEIISTEINENFDDAGGENIDNTPDTDEQTETDEEDIDEEDEEMEDESSLDDTDKSKNKRKEKDEEDEDEEEDTDDLEELMENDEDDDMESSKVSTQSAEQAEMKSANRFVQAGLKNGKIVIIGNSSGSDGISTGGNGAKGESSGEEAANEFVRTETAPGEEYAATIIAVGEGSVIVTISSDEWRFGAGVADTVAVANAVLTAEHKQLVNDGENIEIRLVVKDISGQVPEKDKGIIEDGLNVGQEEEAAKLVPAAYIDISIDIRIGYGSWEAVTQTEEPIKVVVGISEEWSESGTFYIARAHESKYALLDDLDSESNTVTIMTELFSTYAVVYQQLPVIAIDADPIYSFFSSHSWITVTWIGALLFIGVLEILLLIVILLLWKQYKKEKREAQREIVTP